ncbi:MAG: SlyX family protein [Hyphomicrobiales bacterium]
MTEHINAEPPPREWCLYILECAGGRLYTGITLDLEARYKAHATGKGARFTRSYPPERIVFTRQFPNRSEALKAEYAVKKMPAAAKREMIDRVSQAERTDWSMNEQEKLKQSIDELEIRVAHQDRTMEELNEMFAAQWRTIDDMTRKIIFLENRLRSLEQDADAPPSAEPPPPHY